MQLLLQHHCKTCLIATLRNLPPMFKPQVVASCVNTYLRLDKITRESHARHARDVSHLPQRSCQVCVGSVKRATCLDSVAIRVELLDFPQQLFECNILICCKTGFFRGRSNTQHLLNSFCSNAAKEIACFCGLFTVP